MTRAWALRIGLLACVVVGLAWVRQLPLQVGLVELSDPELAAILAEQEDEIRYLASDGRQHVYLGRLDSYLWLRAARNVLDHGTPCDAIVEGKCRNTFSNAPVGRPMFYARSLHPRAIAALHRLITASSPDFPLPSTAFWVQVLLGAACALPAFGIGRALAGDVGGFAAAIVVGLNPIFLDRSLGGDNDVWQVLLPLCMVWAAVRALLSKSTAGALAFAVVAGLFGGLHAADWSGWIFAWAALLCGLIATALLQAVVRRSGRGALIAVVFYVTAGLVATLAQTREPYVAAPMGILGRAASTFLAQRPAPPPEVKDIAWPSNFDYVQETRLADLDTIVAAMGGATLVAVSALGLLLLAVPKLAPRRPPSSGPPPMGPGALLAVWLLAAFVAAFDGNRWSLLLAAPFGLAFGVAVGRLYRAVDAGTQGLSDGLRWTLRGAALLAVLGLLLVPVRNGIALASRIAPRMNDAWWDALSHIRETAPADAIVTTQWDYGYWAAYVAERRVTADGGSLRTQLPYWIARVLLAPSDREATGLLRMLACGSDARPFPEGRQGAYAKLVAAGTPRADAVDWIVQLARLDRDAAESLLEERGLEPEVRSDVLASTHCTPPPAYLVLSTSLLDEDAWLQLGGWDLREGVAGPLGPRIGSWVRCRPEPGGRLDCPTSAALQEPGAGGGKAPVAKIVWDPADRFGAPLRLGAAGSEYLERGKPAMLLIAGADGIHQVVFGKPTHRGLALLIDAERGRYFAGSPQLIRSTYVRLMLLGARGSEAFEKVFERRVEAIERVTAWRVRWPGER